MPLQSTGPISLGDIRDYFGSSGEVSISDFYRGGDIVPDIPENLKIPTSGEIGLGDFLNAYRLSSRQMSKQTSVTLSKTTSQQTNIIVSRQTSIQTKVAKSIQTSRITSWTTRFRVYWNTSNGAHSFSTFVEQERTTSMTIHWTSHWNSYWVTYWNTTRDAIKTTYWTTSWTSSYTTIWNTLVAV